MVWCSCGGGLYWGGGRGEGCWKWGLLRAGKESLEVAREVVPNGPTHLLSRHRPPGVGKVAELLFEHLRDDATAVVPLVDELVEDAGVAVLGGELGAEQLDAHPRDLLDQAGVIDVPPAAEDEEVGVQPPGDGQLVLVLAREDGCHELVARVL